MANNQEFMQQGIAESARYAHSIKGGDNTAFLWWMFTKAAFGIPYIPDPQAMLVMLHLRGATAMAPIDKPIAGDLFVLEGPRFGVVAKPPFGETPYFLGMDNSADNGRPRRVQLKEVQYFLRLSGGT